MKRILTASLLSFAFLLSSCGQTVTPDIVDEERSQNDAQASETEAAEYSFDRTTFYYGDSSYDLTSRCEAINSILSVAPVGEKLVIECHVGPKNGVYCIFDTKSKAFDTDLVGANLTWYNDDITTSVYSFWSDVYAYDGSIVKSYDLAENEFIYDLTLSDNGTNGTKLNVTIVCIDGTDRTDTINLQT